MIARTILEGPAPSGPSSRSRPRRSGALQLFTIAILLLTTVVRADDASMPARIEKLRGRLPGWMSQMEDLKRRGQDVAYPLVTYTVIDNFTPMALLDLEPRSPEAWGWMAVNGSESGAELTREGARSGAFGMKLWNRSVFQPNRYGMLQYSGVVKIAKDTPYTFSAWVKSGGPGKMTLATGAGWQFRKDIPKTSGKWERVVLTFTPADADTACQPKIISEDQTAGVWVDDAALVEGSEAEAGKNLLENPGFEEGWTQRRATQEVKDMEAMSDRLDAMLKDAIDGKTKLPSVPRWTGKVRPKIVGPSLIGPTASANNPNEISQRPIFFTGYGHFVSARRDVEKFPAYGANIIQNGEFGPSALYPQEGKTNLAQVKLTKETLQRGQRVGVAMDLLVSPHYFPGWMFEKYKDLRVQRADFFPYSVFRPEVLEVLRQHAKDVMSAIKDEPALLSVCLSNEPIGAEAPSEYSTRAFREWLIKRHGNVATLNDRWKTKYKSFEEVPQPNPFGPAQGEKRPSPAWSDWVRFNQEYFADFHAQLAKAIKDVAPEIPVHAKATTWHLWRSEQIQSTDDATLFASFSDMMGNDSVNLWGFGKEAPDSAPVERGSKEFAQGWLENALGYDLLRSAKDVPVFNSENHFIFDRDSRYVDPAHIRAGLWQQALHGQSATTLWVWERSNDAQGDFSGNIMDRPICVEALGLVSHDLNRVAEEMTALQNAPADVAILQSFTAATWQGWKYDDALIKLYTALSFSGVKVRFATERQLEAGELPKTKVLFVPNVSHLSAAAAKTLASFTGKVVLVGSGPLLSRDEYDDERAMAVNVAETIEFTAGKTAWPVLWKAIHSKPKTWGSAPVITIEGDQPIGVQWLCAQTPKGTVINLYNAKPDARSFKLSGVTGSKLVDLLTNKEVGSSETLELQPLEVRILRVMN